MKAVDINDSALDPLRGRVDLARYPHLIPTLGEEADPRLAPSSLDAAVIINAYHEMPQYQQMLRKIRAALRPGGRLLLLEPYSLETEELARQKHVELHNFSPALAELELESAGFELVKREDDFVIPADPAAPNRNGLVVRKP